PALDRLRTARPGEGAERPVDVAADRALDPGAAVILRGLVRCIGARLALQVDAGVVAGGDGVTTVCIDRVPHDVSLGIAVHDDAAALVVADGVAHDPGGRRALDVDTGCAIVADDVGKQRRYPRNPQ